MPRAFFSIGRRPRALAGIRRNSDGSRQSVNASVPDGDTAGVEIDGSGSVRFLGIDTVEKSFEQPLGGSRALDSQQWADYLADPFSAANGGAFVNDELTAHLLPRLNSGAGQDHRQHGLAAETALQDMIGADMNAFGQDLETFGYFLALRHPFTEDRTAHLPTAGRRTRPPQPSDPGRGRIR